MPLLISIGPPLSVYGQVSNVVEGASASFIIRTSGAVGVPRLSIQSSTLPSEWSFVDNGDGTATVAVTDAAVLGTFTFTVRAVDNTRFPVRARFEIRVYDQTISATLLSLEGDYPDAVYGEAYSEVLTRTGGTAPYTPSVVSGSLPDGLSLSMDGNNDVLLSGTPDDTFRLVGDFPGAEENVYYDHAMSVVYSLDVVPPLTFSISAGSLPLGLTLDPVTGRVSGEPGLGSPAAIGSPNSFTFTLVATDSASPPQVATSTQTVEVVVPPAPDAETVTWESRINTLGGSVTAGEFNIADDLIKAIKAETFNAKIIYLLPFIGSSIAAHRVPLRDTRNVGAASLVGASPFSDANCDTSTGLANPTEQAAALDTGLYPLDLNPPDSDADTNGGIGFWERDMGFGSGVEPLGCYDTAAGSRRFVLDLRQAAAHGSNMQRFRWGHFLDSQAGPATVSSNGHYYGQRSSATLRRIYKDGASLGDDGTTSAATLNSGTTTMYVMGANYGSGSYATWKGRVAVAYFTDGSLSDSEVSDLHTLLDTYLVTPTGR